MARHIDPKCKLCRREGVKLNLKGDRCETAKCSITKRKSLPGGKLSRRGRKLSSHGIHFREKQKLKRFYGVFERQFRNYYHKAEKEQGNTGENLLIFSLLSQVTKIELEIHAVECPLYPIFSACCGALYDPVNE